MSTQPVILLKSKIWKQLYQILRNKIEGTVFQSYQKQTVNTSNRYNLTSFCYMKSEYTAPQSKTTYAQNSMLLNIEISHFL